MAWSVTWYLLALLPVAAVVYVVRTYRKRNAARAAASSDRFAQIFNTPAERAAAPEAAPAAAPSVTATRAVSAGRTAGSYARRARLLTAQQVQLRELLRYGLPDHEVLASVSLAAVIEVCGLPEGREREQRWRALAQQTVDCVVCSFAHDVVAVVDLDHGSTAETRFKSECMKAAGVRYVRWNPLELPRSNDLRALILDG